ncbi:orotate phosphoribosyltransferase [Imshaugia aleurites]|uniref:Orotate phosphoribosyltransferase n=1 Tax=Imshaugia aleurites TaxID=172621 RepID=A0A8H3ISH6_9LECA|nr:orotate phosphoribosyltransferase [Imshaugia aleurites]
MASVFSSSDAQPYQQPYQQAQEEDPDSLVPSTPPPVLPTYKSAFLQSCLSASVLTFGAYKLKSGRLSPYFFNAGLFHKASLVRSISTAFAQTLIEHVARNPTFQFDVLFGPAYKGIPLATATVDKLAELDEASFARVSYSFNRKEMKDHGEGGLIVGAPLRDKNVVIIDDVITAGTAMREAIEIIKAQGGRLVGVIVALDRKERMSDTSTGSAIGEVRKEFDVPVLSIIDLDDLIGVLGKLGDEEDMEKLREYKRKYGASD